MKLKNLSINKIIDIVRKMTYSKIKHASGYAEYPLEVYLCSKDYDTWEYQVFFETHLFNPTWDITSLRIALFDTECQQYSQDNFIYLKFKGAKAKLYYIERGKEKVLIKSFNRDVNKLKKFLKEKMKAETIKAQKRKSHTKRKNKVTENNYINNLEVAF